MSLYLSRIQDGHRCDGADHGGYARRNPGYREAVLTNRHATVNKKAAMLRAQLSAMSIRELSGHFWECGPRVTGWELSSRCGILR
jgi:hypothetical protein